MKKGEIKKPRVRKKDGEKRNVVSAPFPAQEPPAPATATQLKPLQAELDALQKAFENIQAEIKKIAEQPIPDTDSKAAALEDLQKSLQGQIDGIKDDVSDLGERMDEEAKEHRNESRAIITGVLIAAIITLIVMAASIIVAVVIFLGQVSKDNNRAVNECRTYTEKIEPRLDQVEKNVAKQQCYVTK